MPKKSPEDRAREMGLTDAQILAKAKKGWGLTKKVAAGTAKGAGQVAEITADTLKMSAKEVLSGDAGLKAGRTVTKAGKAVGHELKDIWGVVSTQAKKYLHDVVKKGEDLSTKMDEATGKINKGDIPAPNVGSRKKAIEDRFAEEEEAGISRYVNKKKKK